MTRRATQRLIVVGLLALPWLLVLAAPAPWHYVGYLLVAFLMLFTGLLFLVRRQLNAAESLPREPFQPELPPQLRGIRTPTPLVVRPATPAPPVDRAAPGPDRSASEGADDDAPAVVNHAGSA